MRLYTICLCAQPLQVLTLIMSYSIYINLKFCNIHSYNYTQQEFLISMYCGKVVQQTTKQEDHILYMIQDIERYLSIYFYKENTHENHIYLYLYPPLGGDISSKFLSHGKSFFTVGFPLPTPISTHCFISLASTTQLMYLYSLIFT